MPLSPIHPFPARMAPELAQRALKYVPQNGRILDPMSGSGTVARAAVEAGFRCIGCDIDPLAVLMARVWTTPLDICRIHTDAKDLVRKAKILPNSAIIRTNDPETKQFISYWFAPRQEEDLARLSTVLQQQNRSTKNVLTIALSRIIISKEKMASLARDTSHSRPHKVADFNDFDVYAGFLRSARHVATRLEPELIRGKADIRLTDARILKGIKSKSIDLVLTSPPYLNAIDYLRGHRLGLVWQGHKLGPLRKIRAESVGAERIMPKAESPVDILHFVTGRDQSTLKPQHLGWIRRYACDMDAILRQLRRVVKQNGMVVLVLGDSFLRGAVVQNAKLVEVLAKRNELRLQDKVARDIPARRRYLPPPGAGQGALDFRMRTETVLTFAVP